MQKRSDHFKSNQGAEPEAGPKKSKFVKKRIEHQNSYR
jgi:hypothetical protein